MGNQVEKYYRTYYAELRKQVSSYEAIPEAIPDFLQDYKRRIVIDMCRDGVILTHSVADDLPSGVPEVFRYYGGNYRQGVRVKDLHPDWDYEADSRWRIMIANPQLHKGSDTTGPVVWEAPWKRLDAVSHALVSEWGEELGRTQAKNDVLTFVNAYLMGLKQGDPQETRDRVVWELEAAVSEFSDLLDTEPEEEKVQLYLSINRNKILLEPSAVNIIPKLELGSEYVTDFVIKLPQQRYILVEIEKPGHSLFTKKGRVTAKVTDAQQQVEDWLNWVSDYPSYAQNSMPGIREPQGWVIVGRRNSMSESDRRARQGSQPLGRAVPPGPRLGCTNRIRYRPRRP